MIVQVQGHTQGKDGSLGSGSPLALDSALVSELSGSAELRSALRRQINRQGKKALKWKVFWKWWHTAVITALGRPRVQAQPQILAFSGSVCLIFLSLLLGSGFLVSVCFLISRSTIFLSYCLSLKFLFGRVYILLLIITVVCDVGMFLPRYRGAHWELVLFHAGYVGWTQGFYLYPLSHHLTGPLI